MDLQYGSSVWYATSKNGTAALVDILSRVQAVGARTIIGAFKTAAKQVVCDEATLEPVETSLSRKAAAFVLTTAATPIDHTV